MSNPIFTTHQMDMMAAKNAAKKAGKNEPFPFPSRPGFPSTSDCVDFIICLSNEDQDGISSVCVYKSHHDEYYLFAFSTEEKKINDDIIDSAKNFFKHRVAIREHPGKGSNEVFILD
jgi:hypothetical protein